MATSPAVPQEHGLSEAQRIINTYVAPAKTFDDIKRNASWWAPWLLMSVVALIFIFVMQKKIGFEQISINEIAKSARADQFEKLPPDQKAQQMGISVMMTKVFSYGVPVTILIANVIVAGVLLGLFKLGFGANLTFKRMFAIVLYAGLPTIISSILGIISMQFIDPEAFNVRNPVATNPAYFMDPFSSSKFLYGIASAFDIFVIWVIALIAIGVSRNTKIKTGSAFAAIFAVYFIFKLIGAGLATIF
jgi:hypothetical protein